MQRGILTIVGAGLIGGSIGLAAKARGLARTVRGLGRRRASLDEAMRVGAIDEGFVEPPAALQDADIVVFCTPVDRIAEQIVDYAQHCPNGALLTDAGSTKAAIVEAVAGKLPAGVHFVGSHPLAGSEKRGAGHADARLFEGRWTVVTRTPATDPAALERTVAFWEALGSRVSIMSPEAHDDALALTSHLPHLVAAALAGGLPADLFKLAATGFRDATRIAAGDPELWTAIFQQNREALLTALHRFNERFTNFWLALKRGDFAAVKTLLTEAKEVRDALGS